MPAFSIGTLSRQTGVKIPTIRYYESVGLLREAVRSGSNRRLYDAEAVRRLQFIRHARALGFEPAAIRALLDLQDDPNQSCGEADVIARERLADVDDRIAKLSSLKAELQRMIRDCRRGRVAECRVIEVLADHDQCQDGH
jgi:DNA-binding transcriptional MerR regulator